MNVDIRPITVKIIALTLYPTVGQVGTMIHCLLGMISAFFWVLKNQEKHHRYERNVRRGGWGGGGGGVRGRGGEGNSHIEGGKRITCLMIEGLYAG